MPSGSANSAKTECPNGHPYNADNTYVTPTGTRRCRACHNAQVKGYYAIDPAPVRLRTSVRKAEFRRKANSLKTACIKCGESAIECLDFHHRNPEEKVDSVGLLITNGRPWSIIEAEIQKCDVLCANCHRKVEALKRKERYQWSI